jgi:TetR/AcrR family transcriptional repressor of bet genes
MPKTGMQPVRRDALVRATIAEIGRMGTLDVTVAQIARRAGMSSALAHHYFGSKEQIFLAAMRHVMAIYGAEVRGALAAAIGPRGRVEAIVRAGFSTGSFRRDSVSAWLSFYVLAQTSDEARRLLQVYQRRLRSNLVHALRPLVGGRALSVADRIGATIDGVYIREALRGEVPDGAKAAAVVLGVLALELGVPA